MHFYKLWIVFSYPIIVTSAQTEFRKFRKVKTSLIDVTVVNSLIASSRLHCSIRCSTDHQTVLFSYNNSTKVCECANDVHSTAYSVDKEIFELYLPGCTTEGFTRKVTSENELVCIKVSTNRIKYS